MTSHSNAFALFGQQFLEKLDLLWSQLENSDKSDNEVIAEIFPDAVVLPDSNLHLYKAVHEGHGDVSYFYSKSFLDDTDNRDFVTDMMIVQDTTETLCSQIWQVYLLSHADTILPCFWHGGYGVRTFIFSEDDINRIKHFKNRDWTVISLLEDMLPRVMRLSDNTCQVVCHYWNEWQGMVRETYTYTLDGVIVKDIEKKQEILYPYCCGICY
jgi:hypothetical protein